MGRGVSEVLRTDEWTDAVSWQPWASIRPISTVPPAAAPSVRTSVRVRGCLGGGRHGARVASRRRHLASGAAPLAIGATGRALARRAVPARRAIVTAGRACSAARASTGRARIAAATIHVRAGARRASGWAGASASARPARVPTAIGRLARSRGAAARWCSVVGVGGPIGRHGLLRSSRRLLLRAVLCTIPIAVVAVRRVGRVCGAGAVLRLRPATCG